MSGILRSIDEVLTEYSNTCAQTLELIGRIASETLRQSSTIPWHGAEHALDDLIVYMYYGYKREHAAQIAAFRGRMQQQ